MPSMWGVVAPIVTSFGTHRFRSSRSPDWSHRAEGSSVADELAIVHSLPSPSMSTEPLLRLGGITKSFGAVEVLHGIDLEVERGEVVCIIGPSGSGKSTLLRCVNFIAPPTSGTVVFDGVEYPPADRAPLGAAARAQRAAPAHPVARRDRHGLPALQRVPAPDRREEPHPRPAPHVWHGARSRRERGRWPSWTRSGSPTRPTSTRPGCREVRSSASPSPGRCRSTPS